MRIAGAYFLLAGLAMMACTEKQVESSEPVARAYNKVLTEDELADALPDDLGKEDSSYRAEQFINNWLRENALIHMAELNLPDSAKNFESRLENYRNSLLIYAYEQALVAQKLDTTISEEEVEKYYEANRKDFLLRDYLVKVVFIKVNREAPKLSRLERWFESAGDKDFARIEEYAYQYAENYFFNSDDWLYLDDLVKEMPVDIEEKDELLKKDNLVKLEDDKFVYYLKVLDFRMKDSVAPLSVVRDNIHDLILNRRKVQLVERARKQVFEDAMNDKEIEVYR